MALVDDVESLGSAVDGGALDRRDAVQLLMLSADGLLVEESAAFLIDNWGAAAQLFTREGDAADALDQLAKGMGDDR
ncbi:hypothetical protein [Kitasatospora cineracea]|uniref:Uncharacterized protein n=1 Tax=Kitasatospora cineracea TaxID=88074 RepID=A0A3N4RNF0_9ACTN|nr:hypothetical protein [Kitasatospora cineracea]RPE34932.1 hypothetical protein EDD38_3274 [Kitasatospora cineracea]